MVFSKETHDCVADLLSYPGAETEARLSECLARVVTDIPSAKLTLEPFTRSMETLTRGEREELYCRTFDNNAARALEVGWQLYGENYDRGAFLVRMRDLIRSNGLRENSELPDHLSYALRLLGRLEQAEAKTLSKESLLPATHKMLEGFRDEANPYRAVVELARLVIEDHAEVEGSFDV